MEPQAQRISAELPDGWSSFFKESVTLLAPYREANVIISSEPLDQPISTEQYAGDQGQILAAEFPGYQETSFEPAVVFRRHLGHVREFSWSPPDGVPVTQIQCYLVRDARGYTATATTPSTLFARHEATLRRVLVNASIDA